MMLAALVDLGVPVAVIETALAAVGLGDVEVTFVPVLRSSLRGVHLRARRGAEVITGGGEAAPAHDHDHDHDHHHHEHDADTHDHHDHHDHTHDHAHRSWASIRALLETGLAGETQRLALAIFARLAEVEAARHGVAVEDVAFHEVGAVDSILDVVGCAAALAWLAPRSISVRTIPLGHGRIRTAHGVLPIPAPATLALLTGFAVEDGGVAMEMTTPTGAAIVAAIGARSTELPRGSVHRMGWGAGTKDLADRPNLLRLVVLETVEHASPAEAPTLWQLEANLDDLSPQLCAPLVDALLAAGCRDAWLQPIVMKKGRPGFTVAALVEESHRVAAETALFRNSTTIGLRRTPVTRHELPRRFATLPTPWGDVQVKLAGDAAPGDNDAAPHNVSLEYDDVARLAALHGLTVKELYHQLETLLGPLRQASPTKPQ